MGFKNGAYMKVWKVEPHESFTKLNVSSSKKIRGTDPPEYDTDYSGFVSLVGKAHTKVEANGLSEGDRIHIVDCEVTTKYDSAKDVKYTNFTIWDWEPADAASKAPDAVQESPKVSVNEDEDEDDLPF